MQVLKFLLAPSLSSWNLTKLETSPSIAFKSLEALSWRIWNSDATLRAVTYKLSSSVRTAPYLIGAAVSLPFRSEYRKTRSKSDSAMQVLTGFPLTFSSTLILGRIKPSPSIAFKSLEAWFWGELNSDATLWAVTYKLPSSVRTAPYLVGAAEFYGD
jgi:hypothetical protein